MFVNLIVALTNFVALIFIYRVKGITPNIYYVLFPMSASILYHLAETKHHLPGIYPLNRFSSFLLNVDRFFASVSAIFIGICLYNYRCHVDTRLWTLIPASLLFLALSERDVIASVFKEEFSIIFHPKYYTVGGWEFAFFHGIWHVLAYMILSYFIGLFSISEICDKN